MKVTVKTKWTAGNLSKEVRAATKKAMADATEYILQEANKIVPHDEGTLERSGSVDVEETSKGVSGSVFYDTPYAARLHEHPEYNFQNGREGKYLEKTINNEGDVIKDYLKDAYAKVLKG